MIHVPADVPLTEFSDRLAIAAAPHKPVWLPQFVLFVDAPHSKVMFWEFHSSTANPNQCLAKIPPPFSSWRHWLKEHGSSTGYYSCFPPEMWLAHLPPCHLFASVLQLTHIIASAKAAPASRTSKCSSSVSICWADGVSHHAILGLRELCTRHLSSYLNLGSSRFSTKVFLASHICAWAHRLPYSCCQLSARPEVLHQGVLLELPLLPWRLL